MTAGTNIAAGVQAEILGDIHPLLEQLGSADDLALAGVALPALSFGRVDTLPALRGFLEAYRARILLPVELPLIVAAHGHALRGEARELVALDRTILSDPVMRDFAAASIRVGRRQMSKLRALRDHRVVQRYLAAIDSGDARGWHTLVYGVSLAAFSIPLRQGLQGYTGQTMRGFITAAARPLRLTESECESTLLTQSAHVPGGIEAALSPQAALTVS